jgi:hypothetical protein
MDDGGNILVKRISKSNVYVKQTLEETAVGSEVLKLPQGCLELDKPVKVRQINNGHHVIPYCQMMMRLFHHVFCQGCIIDHDQKHTVEK